MRYRWRSSQKAGFTLIEVMVVLLVIVALIAIAMPNWMHARDSSRSRSCCENLRQIDSAKEQWGMTTTAPVTAEPAPADLVSEYMKGPEDTLPVCPSGGSYTINDLETPPRCSVADNGTPQDFDDHIVP